MGEPNEIAEGVGAINLAGGGFWKPWARVEKKVPTETKDAKLIRVSTGIRSLILICLKLNMQANGIGSNTEWSDKGSQKCLAHLRIQTTRIPCGGNERSPRARQSGQNGEQVCGIFRS
eukprot:g3614.t1